MGQGDSENPGDEPGEMAGLAPIDFAGLGVINVGISDDDTATSSPEDHICAVLAAGSVRCWGRNAFGQCGTGDFVQRGDQPGEMGLSLPVVELGFGC